MSRFDYDWLKAQLDSGKTIVYHGTTLEKRDDLYVARNGESERTYSSDGFASRYKFTTFTGAEVVEDTAPPKAE